MGSSSSELQPARITVESSRSLRLLVHDNGRFHRVARFRWTSRDSSLYIFPTIPLGGIAYAGAFTDIPPDSSSNLDFSKQLQGVSSVKLSLHESGQTHAECDGARGEAIAGAPLFASDAHVASIDCFHSPLLPSLDAPSANVRDLDLVLELPDQEAGVHIGIHALLDTARAIPGSEFKTVVTMMRPTLQQPLHLGFDISARASPPLATEPTVIVIGGWGTEARPDEPIAMAYAVTTCNPSA